MVCQALVFVKDVGFGEQSEQVTSEERKRFTSYIGGKLWEEALETDTARNVMAMFLLIKTVIIGLKEATMAGMNGASSVVSGGT